MGEWEKLLKLASTYTDATERLLKTRQREHKEEEERKRREEEERQRIERESRQIFINLTRKEEELKRKAQEEEKRRRELREERRKEREIERFLKGPSGSKQAKTGLSRISQDPVGDPPAKKKRREEPSFDELMRQASSVDASAFSLAPVLVSKKLPASSAPARNDKSATNSGRSTAEITKSNYSSSRPKESAIERALASGSSALSAIKNARRYSSPGTKSLNSTDTATGRGQSRSNISSTITNKSNAAKPNGNEHLSARERLTKEIRNNNRPVPLQTKKRDLRSVEEIQMDLWRRRGKNISPDTSSAPRDRNGMARPPSAPKSKTPPTSASYRSRYSASPNPTKSNLESARSSMRRPRSYEEEEEEDDDLDDFIDDEEEEDYHGDYRGRSQVSSVISQIFRRRQPQYDDYGDSDDDMEASAADVYMEERRSAKIAKLEDEREEELERQEKERLRQRKLARMGKR
ncbi:uncharacterized protein VTP21DRAFT_3610 [Calcarisporiella thermophila]|uniref:uncharacterized protein n=1 Tax=Calcarisporiella thermophila TaxID=911321 RepID=UPI0037445F57